MARSARCFLSHSSKDKASYVQLVHRKLGDVCIYDEATFEAGMQSLEEILTGLEKTDVFVLFLSNNSLNSDWVRTEILEAKGLFDQGTLRRIYPIIIDNTFHTDQRIPEWMRQQYHLQRIPRPGKAVSLIKKRLREIMWQNYPKQKERQKIFVGRYETISAFEQRLSSFEKSNPFCVVASGVPEMGRKALLRRCCVQYGIFDENYELPSISLNHQQAIEDFIREIYDLGFSESRSFDALINKSMCEKVEIACSLVHDIQEGDEIVSISDNGCIISKEGEVATWFLDLLNRMDRRDKVTFLIASTCKFYRYKQDLFAEHSIYELNVPELSVPERSALLKRYAEFEELKLKQEEYQEFSYLLTGFPPQVFHTIDLIKDVGIHKAKQLKSKIRDYSRAKAKALLEDVTEDELSLLRLIAEFDAVGYELLFKVVDEQRFSQTIEKFLGLSICENLGNNGEYIRANDAVKDFISRIKFSLDIEYEKKLRGLLDDFLATYKSEEKDASDYFYFLKQALKEGREVATSDLIPSHFLRAMQDLYDQEERRYKEVVDLADRALKNGLTLDRKVKNEIRSLFLKSLARLSVTNDSYKDRFLHEMSSINHEVETIGDYQHKNQASFQQHFLYGFYYRLQGRFSESLTRLDKALEIRPNNPSARREKVRVVMDIGDYENALLLAKSNYDEQPANLYHASAYFRCLIFKPTNSLTDDDYDQLSSILSNMETVNVNSSKAKEMSMHLSALMKAYYEQDKDTAITLINKAIQEFPSSHYLKVEKCQILLRLGALPELEREISLLESARSIDANSPSYQSFVRVKSELLAIRGRLPEALTLVKQKLKKYPNNYLSRIESKLNRLSTSSNS